MQANVDPLLGGWFKHLDKGYEFQVVAFDDSDGVVEIRQSDGAVEALEIDDWYEMELEQIEPPEDWADSTDDFDSDASDYSDTQMSADDWHEGLGEWHEDNL